MVAQVTLDLPCPNRATVTLRDPRGRSREQLDPLLHATHRDGTFAGLFGHVRQPGDPQFFAEMPPGRYLLRATVANGRVATCEVDLRAGHVELTLELSR